MPGAKSPAPNSPHKRSAILDAATNVFLDRGYSGTSMDRIAREAGVSKVTVYNHFENKEDLFGAIVAAQCEKLTSVLLQKFSDKGPVEMLTEFAARFLELTMTPQNLSLHRLVLAEAIRFPEVGRQFYEHGPERANKQLAAYLSTHNAKGRLAVADRFIAADQFFGLLMGLHHMRAVLGMDATPSETDWQSHIKRTVEMFVRAHASDRGHTE